MYICTDGCDYMCISAQRYDCIQMQEGLEKRVSNIRIVGEGNMCWRIQIQNIQEVVYELSCFACSWYICSEGCEI